MSSKWVPHARQKNLKCTKGLLGKGGHRGQVPSHLRKQCPQTAEKSWTKGGHRGQKTWTPRLGEVVGRGWAALERVARYPASESSARRSGGRRVDGVRVGRVLGTDVVARSLYAPERHRTERDDQRRDRATDARQRGDQRPPRHTRTTADRRPRNDTGRGRGREVPPYAGQEGSRVLPAEAAGGPNARNIRPK